MSDNVVSAVDRDSAELAVLVAILAVVVVILVAVDEYPGAEASIVALSVYYRFVFVYPKLTFLTTWEALL